MKGSMGFFDEAARVGAEILDVLGGKPASAEIKEYLEHTAEIYNLLADIHSKVAMVAVKTSLAANEAEAREALQELEYDSLVDTFRAQQWCDELERLGHALRPLRHDAELSADDQQIWDQFCQHLEMREGEVAYLYLDRLYDFRQLAHRDLSLKELKEQVDKISKQLVTQKAEFDLLAQKAAVMRQRLG